MNTVYTYEHGQSAMIYPDTSGEPVDFLDLEEVIIEEVISSETIAVRFLGSDDVVTVSASQLSAPFGTPCQCRS